MHIQPSRPPSGMRPALQSESLTVRASGRSQTTIRTACSMRIQSCFHLQPIGLASQWSRTCCLHTSVSTSTHPHAKNVCARDGPRPETAVKLNFLADGGRDPRAAPPTWSPGHATRRQLPWQGAPPGAHLRRERRRFDPRPRLRHTPGPPAGSQQHRGPPSELFTNACNSLDS